MKTMLSQLVFTKQQQVGIIFLVSVILGLLAWVFFYHPNTKDTFTVHSTEISQLQHQLDSLRKEKTKKAQPKIYPFNPNFITEYKGYVLGMTPKEVTKLHAFRASGKWINSVQDFKQVTGVSDSLLAVISPLFTFPDWVSSPKKKKKYGEKYFRTKTYSDKIDLNKATSQELEKVYGIGATLSKRIISFRDKIGGFTDDIQLFQIYGLKRETIQEMLKQFTVKTPKSIVKINLNTASASDISTIPGVSFDLAKKIWEYRVLRERITSFSELEKIEELSVQKLKLIQLYLSLD